MNIEPYLESIRRQLEVAAEAGGDEGRASAERLAAPLEAAVRLAILDALAAAAEEITLDLAPGSVDLRLRGREPEFVVSPPPVDPASENAIEVDDAPPESWRRGEGELSRVNMRLPESLKAQVEQAADREGLSINAWLVRATAAALERANPGRRRERLTPHGAQRHTGWAR